MKVNYQIKWFAKDTKYREVWVSEDFWLVVGGRLVNDRQNYLKSSKSKFDKKSSMKNIHMKCTLSLSYCNICKVTQINNLKY